MLRRLDALHLPSPANEDDSLVNALNNATSNKHVLMPSPSRVAGSTVSSTAETPTDTPHKSASQVSAPASVADSGTEELQQKLAAFKDDRAKRRQHVPKSGEQIKASLDQLAEEVGSGPPAADLQGQLAGLQSLPPEGLEDPEAPADSAEAPAKTPTPEDASSQPQQCDHSAESPAAALYSEQELLRMRAEHEKELAAKWAMQQLAAKAGAASAVGSRQSADRPGRSLRRRTAHWSHPQQPSSLGREKRRPPRKHLRRMQECPQRKHCPMMQERQ